MQILILKMTTNGRFYFSRVTEPRLADEGRPSLSPPVGPADDATVPFLLSAVVLFWRRNSTNNRALKSHRRARYAS